eukprot:2359126-Amphidinium_carterae.1
MLVHRSVSMVPPVTALHPFTLVGALSMSKSASVGPRRPWQCSLAGRLNLISVTRGEKSASDICGNNP